MHYKSQPESRRWKDWKQKNIEDKIGKMELDDFDTEKSRCNRPDPYSDYTRG